MQDVNEAWRVLRDPARRVAYDRSLAPPRAGPPPPRRPAPDDDDDDLVDVAPPVGPGWAHVLRGVPWAVLLVVLGAIFVFTAYAAGGRDDGLVGSCVPLHGSPGTTVVCATPGAARVTSVVEPGRTCPPGVTRVRWDEDGTAVCVSR